MIAPQLRLLPCLLLSRLLLPASSAAGPDSIETVEKAAREWVNIRAETVRLESDWRTQHELLASMVAALGDRAQALEERRGNLMAKTARDRDEFEAMAAKNKAADDDLRAADAQLKTLDGKLVQLRPLLPPRLSAALELPFRSLGRPDLDPGERMQLTMAVLNRCVQFNRTITCGEEVLTVEGEPGARVLEVIYWGLSHGYALDRTAGKAWFGAPGAEGWRWTPCPDAARQVADLITIYNDKAEPDFIAVPGRLGHVPAASANP